jgi:hypothetical protein
MEHENEENDFYLNFIQHLEEIREEIREEENEEELYYFKKVLNRQGMDYDGDSDEDINDGFKEDSDTDDSDADDEDY